MDALVDADSDFDEALGGALADEGSVDFDFALRTDGKGTSGTVVLGGVLGVVVLCFPSAGARDGDVGNAG